MAVCERLKQDALEHAAQMIEDSDLERGILMGYAFALDALWDYLDMFELEPKDLTWEGFNPEPDLLRFLSASKRSNRSHPAPNPGGT